jgi:tRNA-splicing ligase RtcB (3'-phosphate/5'-hydroxy nucleic acid ligase)
MSLKLIPTAEAEAILPLPGDKGKPITVIGNEAIRATFDEGTLQQAINSRMSPGVSHVVLNPDAHVGYGAPIGCVMSSPTHIYPGPVGVDIKCSMSLLQLDLLEEVIVDKKTRRALINAILERTPTGAGQGQRSAKKARRLDAAIGEKIVTQGASKEVCEALGIPLHWAERCEDSHHVGHDDTVDALALRLEYLRKSQTVRNFADKIQQLGSYGGGNHFGECEVVRLAEGAKDRTTMLELAASHFGLKDGHVAFLSHCGSRGFGNILAQAQFKVLQKHFTDWSIPFPGTDKHLVYAPLGSQQANDYLDDMALGANFATVNHLLINTLVLEAFQEILPGVTGDLVYFISHNIARKEFNFTTNVMEWVHRKGATRAFPPLHPGLRGSRFERTGHPILLPGNPRDGSVVMVADAGAEKTCYSVNHGAGRALGRKAAIRALDQKTVDAEMDAADILSNCRQYPKDEAPDAYKDFAQVVKSVETAGLAKTVCRLDAKFVIKDSSAADD